MQSMQPESKVLTESFQTKKPFSIKFINTLLRKIQRNIEDYGPSVALKKGFAYSFKPIYENRIFRIYCIDLREYQRSNPTQNNLNFKLIAPIDKSLIHQIERAEEWLHGEVDPRLAAKRAICLVALDGEKVAGYLSEQNIPENSVTETYASLKLYIDNWRWRNVPFYLRTGKRRA